MKSCNKKCYREKKTAKRVLRLMRKKGRAGMRAYSCLNCHYWHIGHTIDHNIMVQKRTKLLRRLLGLEVAA